MWLGKFIYKVASAKRLTLVYIGARVLKFFSIEKAWGWLRGIED